MKDDKNIFEIIAELDEGSHQSSITPWEDRTTADRVMDFIQTCDAQTLGSLALIGGIVLALLAVPFL